jgi:hypothetical protein
MPYFTYSDIIAGFDFIHFVIETSGVWGQQALSLVKDIGRQIAAVTHELRSTTFCANTFHWLYSVETPSAFWGHLSWSVMRTRSWIAELNINQTFHSFADFLLIN